MSGNSIRIGGGSAYTVGPDDRLRLELEAAARLRDEANGELTRFPALRLVLIEWLDAFGCSSTWEEVGDVHPRAMRCRSVGWLVHDGEDCKVVVPHLSEADHDDVKQQGCGDMTIPTCTIRYMVDLTPPARGGGR